ncbi:FG-GAP-like repeat-containing protein [Roseibacillus persicicus]|uniref:FG-GAP-like repeat-containing protein n=1 Tax=Roseibacillus persicicus TaxID=454148 RepID=UPI00280E6401|nr:FG-GAP-like repeat-containing protein [Roseibacillus persicicus]MDQ8189538.1 FG-GAP-like repeat-containing protein [Roseibacillus persicicus]
MNTKSTLTLMAPTLILAGGLWALVGEKAAPTWQRQLLTQDFLTEGVSLGDLNGDGKPDLVAGAYWFAGPDFAKAIPYRPATPWKVKGYAEDSFLSWVDDLDGDGHEDILMVSRPGNEATWYRNPGKEPSPSWEAHRVAEGVATECPEWTDLTGDGRPELVYMEKGRFGFAEPNWEDATQPWKFHPISEVVANTPYVHGMGIGDVNGDGRADLLEKGGWFEQPDNPKQKWKHHSYAFSKSRGGAQMLTEDWDGDGDNDVVTSLDGHGYGLAWYENKGVDENGEVKFEAREILPENPAEQGVGGLQFSQLHALVAADLNGDGRRDFVTGKRYWAHNGNDPGADGPALLVGFLNRKDAAGIRWEAVVIDSDSGVGCQVQALDLDGDGRSEIASGNKKGVSLFRQTL